MTYLELIMKKHYSMYNLFRYTQGYANNLTFLTIKVSIESQLKYNHLILEKKMFVIFSMLVVICRVQDIRFLSTSRGRL